MDKWNNQNNKRYKPHYARKRKNKGKIFWKMILTALLSIMFLIFLNMLQQYTEPDYENIVADFSDAHFDAVSDELPESVVAFAEENGLMLTEYPEQMIDLLQKNPETEEFVLNYPLEHQMKHDVDISEYADSEEVPLLIQWDKQWGYLEYAGEPAGLSGCGPMCLSMVGYFLTGDEDTFRPDHVMEFATNNGYSVRGNGSKWTLIGQGGTQLGLDVAEIPLDQMQIEENLSIGNPIICVVGPGDFTSTGHFIVLTGIEDGQYTVNDPNSHANSERLWSYAEIQDQIENLWVIRYPG